MCKRQSEKHTVSSWLKAGITAFFLIGFASYCATGIADTNSKKMTHITIQLDYQIRGDHAMFYVAKQKGYFKKEGIVVDHILTGDGSPNTLRLVGRGRGDFGFSDLPSLAVARSRGLKVTALAAVNQTSPMAMCAKKSRFHLRKPQDLKGLTVGIQHSGSTYYFFKALLSANGLSEKDLTVRSVRPPYENYLLTDKVDTVVCYTDSEVPILEDKAGGPNSISVMLGSKFGYDAYGSGVFTSDSMIKKHPKLVQRFMDAYIRAFKYTEKHPQKAAEILASSDPKLKNEESLFVQQLKADESTFASAETKAHGLGTMSRETWEKTVDMLVKQNVIKSKPKISKLYNNSFVKKANLSK